MKPLPPSLLDGIVGHTRQSPRHHVLRYPLLSILTDIDGLDENTRKLTGWTPQDHGDGSDDLRGWVREQVRAAGVAADLGRIQILTAPRRLGVVFNPLSVFFAYDREDALRGVVFEVSNFHAGRGIYAFPVDDPDAEILRFDCAKDFFVSPFNPVSGHYAFKLERDEDRYRLGIRYERDGACVMTAVHTAAIEPLTAPAKQRRQLGLLINTPRTVASILFEALKLRLKGLQIHAPRRGTVDTQPWRS